MSAEVGGLSERERKSLLVYLDQYDEDENVNESELYGVVERIVAEHERAAEVRGALEVLRRTAVEVRKYADTFDDIGSGGAPALLYGVAETIDNSADRIEKDRPEGAA